MPQRHLAVLADGHITSDDAGRISILTRALTELPGSVERLYVLGDLFEVWLGVRSAQAHVDAFAAAVSQLRRRGVSVGYVEGNRDFRVARGPHRGLFDAVSGSHITVAFGRRTYHLTHGDLVNRADRQYLAWRFVSKRFLVPAAMAVLPDATLIRLGNRVEEAMRTTNRKHKTSFPTEACLEYTRRAMMAGADTVVAGHFHKALKLDVYAGDRKGLFVSLPFWHQEPRLVLFDEDGRPSGLEDES